MPSNPFPLSREQLLQAYRTMRIIREFEERLHVEFAKGEEADSSEPKDEKSRSHLKTAAELFM